MTLPWSESAIAPPRPVPSLGPVEFRTGEHVRDRLLDQAARHLQRHRTEFADATIGWAGDPQTAGQGQTDFLFSTDEELSRPQAVFDRIRWGGEFVFVGRDRARVAEVEKLFNHEGGFVIETNVTAMHPRLLGLHLKWLPKLGYFFAARKTVIIPPGSTTDRFTYHVELIRHKPFGENHVVMKQVPSLERVVARLKEKFPDVDDATLELRAKKFTLKIFPIFLTREAAILQILQEKLPPAYKNRVPHVIGLEKDANGYVRTLYMNWLRNGTHGRPLTQLEFASQSAELLAVLHDVAEVIHLDLRLDNVVVTPQGVGFVDFGSAVRVGEKLSDSALLSGLFEEMMRTSQIQRMLGKMTQSGQVTSELITNCYQKIDKGVDFFYLAVQVNSPHLNPDLKGLVQMEPGSAQQRAISRLTKRILRPANPAEPDVKNARALWEQLQKVPAELAGTVS